MLQEETLIKVYYYYYYYFSSQTHTNTHKRLPLTPFTPPLPQAFFSDFREWFASVPGIDEAMSLANLLEHSHSDYEVQPPPLPLLSPLPPSLTHPFPQKIVIDTAPTGHTLRLLQLPAVLQAGLAKLDSWQTRLGAVLGSVASMLYSGGGEGDGASQAEAIGRLREKLKSYQVFFSLIFFSFFFFFNIFLILYSILPHKKKKVSVEKVAALFRDSNITNFICVAIAENLSVFETIRLVAQLRKEGISTTHILVNQLVSTSFAQISDSAEPLFEVGGKKGKRERREGWKRMGYIYSLFSLKSLFFLGPQSSFSQPCRCLS